MRLFSTLLLVSSALSLAACGGGESLKTSSIASGVGSNCPISEVDNTPDCATDDDDDDSGGVVTPPDDDGDGIPNVDDTDGGTGSGAGGNDTSLVNGNRTIILRSSKLDKPTEAGDVALSELTTGTATTLAATTEEILSANKPKTMKIRIDSKSDINSNLAVATDQTEYAYGTRDLRWVMLGHVQLAGATRSARAINLGNQLRDENGNATIAYDPVSNRFMYTAQLTSNGVTHFPGQFVDHTTDHYWNQLQTFMSAKANGGAGGNYREYRARSNSELDARDELLQVWAFQDSYATQYVNGASGGEPKQQAWAIGGRAATNVPTGGTGTYNGRWVGTAKTANWIKPDGAEIDPNALWMVQGSSRFTANFDTSNISGELTPESWTTNQNNEPLHTWYTAPSGEASVATAADPNYDVIYDTKVIINGTIHNDGTAGSPNNQFSGTASLSGGYVSGDNPVQGGFYGTNGNELTGVFNVDGGLPQPLGGSTGITDGREGQLTINGAFNANCTNPGGVCAP